MVDGELALRQRQVFVAIVLNGALIDAVITEFTPEPVRRQLLALPLGHQSGTAAVPNNSWRQRFPAGSLDLSAEWHG